MALETFPAINPRYVYEVSPEFRTAVNEFGDAGEERVQLWTSAKRRWNLYFRLGATDRATLEAFFVARKGRKEAFYWTCELDDVQYTVRFDTDRLDVQKINVLFHVIRFPLVTCSADE